ncbi:MAG TPA: hypothetical protein VNF99_10315, partial [Stellaceae bacterium]|nr:hypothetical protein [Stellaceae bacterium]
MSKFSSFSSYSITHGNKNNWTGCLISPQDSKQLERLGFGIGAPIGAEGIISTDGTVDLTLSSANAAGTVRRYASDGSTCFDVSLDPIRLRSGNRVERLTRAHDIHVSKLIVQVDKGVVRLISSPGSHFGKSKKRNASARIAQSLRLDSARAETSAVAAMGADRPLVSYVKKIGDNYALLVSQPVLEHAGLSEGSRVELEAVDGRIMISRSKRHFTLDELLAGMTPDREHPLEDDTPR